MSNKQRIRFLRAGDGADLSNAQLAEGQPLFLKDRNYLCVGNNEASAAVASPITTRAIEGFYNEFSGRPGSYEHLDSSERAGYFRITGSDGSDMYGVSSGVSILFNIDNGSAFSIVGSLADKPTSVNQETLLQIRKESIGIRLPNDTRITDQWERQPEFYLTNVIGASSAPSGSIIKVTSDDVENDIPGTITFGRSVTFISDILSGNITSNCQINGFAISDLFESSTPTAKQASKVITHDDTYLTLSTDTETALTFSLPPTDPLNPEITTSKYIVHTSLSTSPNIWWRTNFHDVILTGTPVQVAMWSEAEIDTAQEFVWEMKVSGVNAANTSNGVGHIFKFHLDSAFIGDNPILYFPIDPDTWLKLSFEYPGEVAAEYAVYASIEPANTNNSASRVIIDDFYGIKYGRYLS